MASISRTTTPSLQVRCIKAPIFLHRYSPSTLYIPNHGMPGVSALKVGNQDVYGPDLLKKPVISPPEDQEEKGGSQSQSQSQSQSLSVDCEDQILEDTVPLVGFVRMILHSTKYKNGDRLSAEHEKIIVERLLPYHPGYERKIGCGIDYIMVGYHPEFGDTRCLFIVQKNGELVDFSYWKCLKGMIRKKYPLYADSFILRHFRRHRHDK